MSKLDLNIEPNQFKTILVGVDESEQGYFALVNAVHQAREDDSKLVIATILEMGDLTTIEAMSLTAVKAKRAEYEENLERYREFALSKGVKDVQTVFEDGSKAGDILVHEIAPEVQADLIIIGAHSREGFWDSLGSQATYVSRHARVSVMVARQLYRH